MPHELLEEIRLLGNIETATTKLLNIVLCGQPELADRLNDASLRQLKQRVALRCELQPLTLDETAAYISGRLRIAGGCPGEIFTRETVIAIHKASAGIPRTINVLCDNALIGGLRGPGEAGAGRDRRGRLPRLRPAGGSGAGDARFERNAGARRHRTKAVDCRNPSPPVDERQMFGAMAKPKRRFTFFS